MKKLKVDGCRECKHMMREDHYYCRLTNDVISPYETNKILPSCRLPDYYSNSKKKLVS